MLRRTQSIFQRIKYPYVQYGHPTEIHTPFEKTTPQSNQTHDRIQKNSQRVIPSPIDQEAEKLKKIVNEGEHVLSELKDTLQEAKKTEQIQEQRQQTIQENNRQIEHHNHQEEIDKFNEFAIEAPKPILKISAVFPLDLFPDKLIVDPVKVSHVHRIFFASNQVRSISVKEIKFVILENGPIFSTLRISDNMLQPTIFTVKPLWKAEAKKAHDIIQGLMQIVKQHIDTTKITPVQQVSKLEEIGELQED